MTSTGSAASSQDDEGHDHGDGHGHGHDNQGNGEGSVVAYSIADSAGHSLTLQISVKNDGNEVKASVLSMKYGSSSPITTPHNELSFQYSLAKDGSLKTLEQSVSADGTAHVQAHFNADKDTTTITTGSQNSGRRG